MAKLDSSEFSKLADMIEKITRQIAEQRVAEEARLIPHAVNDHLGRLLRSELRELVKQAVKDAITIEVKVNA